MNFRNAKREIYHALLSGRRHRAHELGHQIDLRIVRLLCAGIPAIVSAPVRVVQPAARQAKRRLDDFYHVVSNSALSVIPLYV